MDFLCCVLKNYRNECRRKNRRGILKFYSPKNLSRKKVQIYSRFCLADKDLVCIFAMFFAKEISCLFCKKL